jgi:hypothetical protein
MFKVQIGIIGAMLLLVTPDIIIAPENGKIRAANEVTHGRGPGLAMDESKIHLVYASGDSILYSYSLDKGKVFSEPVLVAVLKGLMIAGGRGPQIVYSKEQLLIAAPASSGDIHTFIRKKTGGSWMQGGRINDIAGMAKEGFVSLAGNNSGQIFAVWLDLRSNAKNNIYGAKSVDGGKTWLKNQLIYQSPDGSVCECCKPSVAAKGQLVAVMFRNNVNGNRDLYVIQSKDSGVTYGVAQKLGQGSWKLNGCPMDGGGLVIYDDNTIRTVWRREGNVYTNEPGKLEELLVKGWQCSIAGKNNRYFIAFINDGKVYCREPDGITIEIGQGGSYPKLIMVDESTILCAWETGNLIHKTLFAF